jgi:hypothetical protein
LLAGTSAPSEKGGGSRVRASTQLGESAARLMRPLAKFVAPVTGMENAPALFVVACPVSCPDWYVTGQLVYLTAN